MEATSNFNSMEKTTEEITRNSTESRESGKTSVCASDFTDLSNNTPLIQRFSSSSQNSDIESFQSEGRLSDVAKEELSDTEISRDSDQANHLFDNKEEENFLDINEESEDKEDCDEDEQFSRGRSRSRSITSDVQMPFSATVVDTSTISIHDSPIASPILSPIQEFRSEKGERKGPLHTREVLALKKGLEQATHSRNKEEIQEEEQERLDAEAERLSRLVSSTSTGRLSIPNLSSPQSGSEPILRKIKILLLGDSGVGKSSLILRWTMDSFNPTLVSTVGVNFKSKKLNIEGDYLQVQVWDTAGQEQFHKITTSYYRGANGIMLVYDVSDKKTLDNVEYWIRNIKTNAAASVPVLLVGNKSDLRAKDTTSTESEIRDLQVAENFQVPYFETSALTSNNVDNAFMTLVQTIVDKEKKALSLNFSSLTPDRIPNNSSTTNKINSTLSNIFKGSKSKKSNPKAPNSFPNIPAENLSSNSNNDTKDCSIS